MNGYVFEIFMMHSIVLESTDLVEIGPLKLIHLWPDIGGQIPQHGKTFLGFLQQGKKCQCIQQPT